MKSILRTSAFVFAAVMFASSISGGMAYQNDFIAEPVNAQETAEYEVASLSEITEHIDFYNNNKSDFDIQSDSLKKLIDTAKSDNVDNTYVTLNVVGKKAGIDVSKFEWSDSLAAQVITTEILMSSEFINASAKAYQNEYNSIVEGLLAQVRKSDSNADKNSIYNMSADSFNTFMKSSGLSNNNLTQIKNAFSATKSYYDYCVAFAAYKKSRTVITDTLSLCSGYLNDEDSKVYADLLKAIAESYTAIAFADFQKAAVKPELNSDISLESSEKIVTSCISQLLNGNCMTLSTLMIYVRMSLHKDINFFSEILAKYDCQVKSRAEERDLFKSAYLLYKGAAASLADSSGFASVLMSDGTVSSLDKFESGMAFYKKSALLMLGHAQQYAVIKSVKDSEFETQSLQTYALIAANDVNNLVCHGDGRGLMAPSAYNAFTVSGPVNVVMYNGSEKAAEIANGKVTVTDKKNLMSLNIIQLSETEKNPAQTIVIPAEFDIKITASGDGVMTLSNVKSEEGKSDISSLYTDIPLKNTDKFEIDMNKYILKNVSQNLSYPDEIKKDIPGAAILKGDVDNNGVVNAKDLVYMQKCILSPDTVSMPGSDINGDGKTDSLDMVELKNLFLE